MNPLPSERALVRRRRRHDGHRGGFSFTEILFAVMILGAGFIMVAAIFPVAIQQTRATSDETVASEIAVNAANTLQRIATTSGQNGGTPPLPLTNGILIPAMFQPNLTIQPTDPANTATTIATVPMQTTDAGLAFWMAVKDNLLVPSNPSYAWIPFYSRDVTAGNPQTWAQVVILCVRVRSRPAYDNSDIDSRKDYFPNFVPRLVKVTTNTATGPYYITYASPSDIDADSRLPQYLKNLLVLQPRGDAYVRTGCYLIMLKYGTTLDSNGSNSCRTYYIYRVGNPSNKGSGYWDLQPGGDALAVLPTLTAPPNGDPVSANGDPPGFGVITPGQYTVPSSSKSGLAYLIGAETMGRQVNTAGTNPAGTLTQGPAQEIGCYVTFVSAN